MKKVAIFLSLFSLTLAGCGRAGKPVAPGPDDQIRYPAAYPSE